jgi:hypothetical protein
MSMRNHSPTGGCPAGWLEVYLPPDFAPHVVTTPAGSPRVGTPVTITFAAVSGVFAYTAPAGQQKGPAQYGFLVGVPASDLAAVNALITQGYNAADALGFSVGGRLLEAPGVSSPFSGKQLNIAVFSRDQALQLYRPLVPSA